MGSVSDPTHSLSKTWDGDRFAQLVAAAADQLRGQRDGVADAFVEHSARAGDPAVRKDIARQVSNLFSGIGSLRGTVVHRDGLADAEATRMLDKTLKELHELVTAELAPPIVEFRKSVDVRRLLVRHREIPGEGCGPTSSRSRRSPSDLPRSDPARW